MAALCLVKCLFSMRASEAGDNTPVMTAHSRM